MKHIFNTIRFIIYLPIALTLLLLSYYLIGLSVGWLAQLSLFLMIVLCLFLGTFFILGSAFLFGIFSSYVSKLNPYKKAGGWVLIPIAVSFGILTLISIWGSLDLKFTKSIIVAIVSTLAIFYTTIMFCGTISSKEKLF